MRGRGRSRVARDLSRMHSAHSIAKDSSHAPSRTATENMKADQARYARARTSKDMDSATRLEHASTCIHGKRSGETDERSFRNTSNCKRKRRDLRARSSLLFIARLCDSLHLQGGSVHHGQTMAHLCWPCKHQPWTAMSGVHRPE